MMPPRWHAVRKIHSPSGTIRPLSSASGTKAARRHQAMARMMPAHERFEAGDLPVDMSLRLIVELKLAPRNRGMQVLLQSALFAQLLVHRHFEESDRSTHVGLGAEERRVGIGNQCRRVDPILRVNSDADRQTHSQRMAVDVDIGIECRQYPFGERLRHRRFGASRGDDRKFVTTQPGEEGALACRLQPARHLPEQSVADVMPEYVVDGLEAVEIHRQAARSSHRKPTRARSSRRCNR